VCSAVKVGRPCSKSIVIPAGMLVLAEPFGRSSGGMSLMRCAASKVRDTICVNVAVSTQGTVDCSSWRGSVPVRGGASRLCAGMGPEGTGAGGSGAGGSGAGGGAAIGGCVVVTVV